MISCVAASLTLAAAARATPATPTISVQQQESLKMRLSASSGTHWSWTVVDGTGATVATSASNPATVTFGAPGDYTALVDATDDDPIATSPAHAEARFHVYVKPVAGFTYAQQSDGTIRFTDTSTSEPTAWTWTFPGDITYKGRTPPPQVLPPGTTTVTLKVTNAAGNNTISIPVIVNGPPQPVLSVLSSPAAINAAVVLDASRSTDPNQDVLSFSWDLDGNGRFGDATGALQTVSYATPGRYLVAVQVSDGRGGVSTAQSAITVLADQAPVVAFGNDPVQPPVGATVSFTATASDPDGSVTRIEWDLDDDGQFDDAAGAVASWSFLTAGAHRVAVRAVDDRDVATVAFRTVDVVSPVLPTPPAALQAVSIGPFPAGSASDPLIPRVSAPSSTRPAMLAPFPIVRIRGQMFRDVARISLLKVQAPAGATIRVRCRGGSCVPRRADVSVKAARTPVRVRSLERRPLEVGTIVEVFVTAPHRIGKYTRFTIRHGASPGRTDLCLAPGRPTPTACPSA